MQYLGNAGRCGKQLAEICKVRIEGIVHSEGLHGILKTYGVLLLIAGNRNVNVTALRFRKQRIQRPRLQRSNQLIDGHTLVREQRHVAEFAALITLDKTGGQAVL